jgi:myosin V
MDVGVEVEVLVDGAWTPGLIIDRYVSPIDVSGAVATVKFDDGTVHEFSVPEDVTKSPPNMRVLAAAMDDSLDVDDLTSLMELSESTILSALDCRFRRDKIYTRTGTILLAVNPFQKLRGLYDATLLQQYIDSFDSSNLPIGSPARRRSSQPQQGRRGSSIPDLSTKHTLPPHVYQVAGGAYRQMLSGMNGILSDQSILVSGESGSGKTESTKFLMQYLAAQAGGGAAPFNPSQSMSGGIQHGIAAKVLQTNTLLESFGNARTLRNDNSSRFGKFIKLHFTNGGKLTGASIQTYLLEKVRLVSQSKGERNYHIFYEMAMGASPAQRRRWSLDPPPSSAQGAAADSSELPETMRQFLHYRFLNQSQCYKRHDGVDDGEMFHRVGDALEVVGFTPFEQAGIFDLLAALMHIGNLTFEHDERDSSGPAAASTNATDLAPSCIWSRDAAARLLAVDASQLERALSVRKIRAGTDFVSVKLSAEQANNARDALARALYGRLFDWMVCKINEFLKMDDAQKAKGHFIGILDIFGFEVFPHNSFEQLCINFANETLQLQFNDYIFKMEQQEYEAQGVDWKYVEFLDNLDCVNLISQRPYGILPLIDEECLIPKGNDVTFASKVYKAWDDHVRFSASRIQKANGNFTIIHYAGPVEYSTSGFLEKNKDTLHQEAVDLLVHSPRDGSFTKMLSEGTDFRPRDKASPRQRAAANKQRGASVGWQFKEQLTTLLETLQQTNPHYVRCLKPNDACEASVFARDRVINQLRCNGVMEAVRVARAGYPIRVPHEEFVARYFCLKRVRSSTLTGSDKTLSTQSLNQRGSSCSALVVAEAKDILKDLLVYLPKEHTTEAQSAFEHSDQVQFATRCISVGVQMGFTKMFLKKTTYDALEEMRTQRVRRHMIKVYHAVLCATARRRYLRFRFAVQSLQIAFRYRLATKQRRRRKALAVKKHYARIVQANLQMVNRRNKYRRFLQVVKLLQCRFRYRQVMSRRRRAQSQRDQQNRERQAAQAKLERQRAEERARLEKQQAAEKLQAEQRRKQSQPMQYKDSSYTASSDSSSEASLTSNDIEGDGYNSSASSDDQFTAYNDQPFRKHTLKTVDESSNQLMPRKFSTSSLQRPSQIVNNIRPIDGPPRPLSNHRVSRTFSDASQSGFGQPPRKSSAASAFRNTRSSRAVALPRLDVVQQTQWVNDEDRFSCHICNKRFNMFKRKHHCRACGEVICNSCSLYHRIQNRSMRVCVSCVAFHSLDSPTEASSTKSTSRGAVGGFSANRKTSTGSNFELTRSEGSSGIWMNAWPEPPYPDDEEERLTCLRELNIRELATSGKFNMYCEVAAKTMKCPIAYVSILEDEEQILVANIGMAHTTLPRELSFCAHTICQPSVLVVLDTKSDERFRENPMVKGEKGAVKIRYYAGATIFSRDGHALGTVAVLDTKPRREADQEHIGMLQHLSFLASEKMMQSTIHGDSDSEIL